MTKISKFWPTYEIPYMGVARILSDPWPQEENVHMEKKQFSIPAKWRRRRH